MTQCNTCHMTNIKGDVIGDKIVTFSWFGRGSRNRERSCWIVTVRRSGHPRLEWLGPFFVDKLFILCEVIQIIFEIQPVIFDHLDFRRRLPSFGLFLHSYKLYPDEPLSIWNCFIYPNSIKVVPVIWPLSLVRGRWTWTPYLL